MTILGAQQRNTIARSRDVTSSAIPTVGCHVTQRDRWYVPETMNRPYVFM